MVDYFLRTNNTYSIDTFPNHGTIPDNVLIDDVVGWTEALEPQETDFLTWVGSGDVGDSPIYRVGSSFLPELETTVAAGGVVGSNSNTTLNVAAGTGVLFKQYDIVRIYDAVDGTLHETMGVVSISADAVTVDRNVDTAGASATIAATDLVVIESSAHPERSDFVISVKARGLDIPNAYQTFVGGADSTWKAQNTPTYEELNYFLSDMKRAVVRAKFDYERAILNNVAYTIGDPSTTPKVPSQFGGLPYWIQTNVTSLSGATITRNDFENEFYSLWEATGAPNIVACMGPRTKQVINRLLDPVRRTTLESTTIGTRVEEILTDVGSFKFMTFRNMLEGQIYFLNKADLHTRTYKGLDWTESEKPGKLHGRDWDERFISATKSFYVTNEHRNARLTGISLVLADYPDLDRGYTVVSA
jgi:hypothetical protein